MKNKLHFSRFEFKYILPQGLRDELESELQYFIELDPYVEQKAGAKYMVRSLYFDNQAMSAYYEKIDGMMLRAKFRIRTYTRQEHDGTPEFLEVKGRHNALVFKHRIELENGRSGDASWESRFTNGAAAIEQVASRIPQGDLRARFVRDVYRKRLRPLMLIDYQRRPYVSKYDPEFRITFDDTLSCAATERLFPRPYESSRSILPGYTILEVKFRHHVPKWFHSIIQAFELRRVSISKYCAGVEAYELAPKLE